MFSRLRSNIVVLWIVRLLALPVIALLYAAGFVLNLRKMAIDGYVVKLDLPELRELVSLLRYSSNNLNQFTRRAHETGRIYETDLEDIQQSQERIWTAAEKIVSSLAALK